MSEMLWVMMLAQPLHAKCVSPWEGKEKAAFKSRRREKGKFPPPAKALFECARWQRDVPLAGPRNLTKIIPVPEL